MKGYKHIIVGTFSDYANACSVVVDLGNAGFDANKLSIISIGSEIAPRSSDTQIRQEIIKEKPLRYVGAIEKGRFVVILSGSDRDIQLTQQFFNQQACEGRSLTKPMNRVLCHYSNCTPHVEIARVSHGSNIYLERVIFPLQRIFFEAPLEAQLETFTSEIAGAILSDRIACSELLVLEPSSATPSVVAELLPEVTIRATTLFSSNVAEARAALKDAEKSPTHA
ncbi:DUF1830 domain-containing protein [Tumidithrix elongata RA019]|uniref:DUF1830 domain-containing protein n=1 Tax=Tumidithrix elongata BACA0141 TaxID=2716417 RepID=A0AAW9PVE2_9CYAN|nr:DUF1830 domain-containing protein [Tumidithrix elongata RA019]